MITLDHDFLRETGLARLPSWEANAFLKHVYETLESRVGATLAQRMSDEQLDEFEAYIDGGDETGAERWLAANFPDYKDMVQATFAELKLEVTRLAPEIMAISASDR